MIFLVSYDLKKPGRDYSSLYALLKSAPQWWHFLESTWLLHTNESLDNWGEKIRNVMDQNDHFIIVDITRRARQGWLPEEAWKWIQEYE
ncbi:MAG: hypothetical protein V3U73_10885 [bacterium]